MERALPRRNDIPTRLALAAFFVLAGALIIIVFSQYRPLLSGTADLLGRLTLLAALLAGALLARKSKSLYPYWPLTFALFIMLAAVSLDWWAAGLVSTYLGGFPNSPAGIALEKLKTVLVVAGTVILLTRASGGSLSSIYLQRGSLKQGLGIGLAAFAAAAAGSIPMSVMMFAGQPASAAEILGWALWILAAVLGNAANEELLFRGLFLRKLEPFYGRLLSNCLIVFVFTGLHLGVTYTRDQMLFLGVVMLLALAWGWLMQKTDSIWGSVLFHAGTDIPVFLAIFSARF